MFTFPTFDITLSDSEKTEQRRLLTTFKDRKTSNPVNLTVTLPLLIKFIFQLASSKSEFNQDEKVMMQNYLSAFTSLLATGNIKAGTLDAKNTVTIMNIAAYFGHTAAIDALVKTGGDINQSDSQGMTPLLIVIENLQEYLLSKLTTDLINRGADVNVRNSAGKTALNLIIEQIVMSDSKSFNLSQCLYAFVCLHSAGAEIGNNIDEKCAYALIDKAAHRQQAITALIEVLSNGDNNVFKKALAWIKNKHRLSIANGVADLFESTKNKQIKKQIIKLKEYQKPYQKVLSSEFTSQNIQDIEQLLTSINEVMAVLEQNSDNKCFYPYLYSKAMDKLRSNVELLIKLSNYLIDKRPLSAKDLQVNNPNSLINQFKELFKEVFRHADHFDWHLQILDEDVMRIIWENVILKAAQEVRQEQPQDRSIKLRKLTASSFCVNSSSWNALLATLSSSASLPLAIELIEDEQATANTPSLSFKCPGLVSLKFKNYTLDRDQLMHLRNDLTEDQQLEELSLIRTNFCAADEQQGACDHKPEEQQGFFAWLSTMAKLKQLDLSENIFTDDQIGRLIEYLRSCSLRSLNLQSCKIPLESAEKIIATLLDGNLTLTELKIDSYPAENHEVTTKLQTKMNRLLERNKKADKLKLTKDAVDKNNQEITDRLSRYSTCIESTVTRKQLDELKRLAVETSKRAEELLNFLYPSPDKADELKTKLAENFSRLVKLYISTTPAENIVELHQFQYQIIELYENYCVTDNEVRNSIFVNYFTQLLDKIKKCDNENDRAQLLQEVKLAHEGYMKFNAEQRLGMPQNPADLSIQVFNELMNKASLLPDKQFFEQIIELYNKYYVPNNKLRNLIFVNYFTQLLDKINKCGKNDIEQLLEEVKFAYKSYLELPGGESNAEQNLDIPQNPANLSIQVFNELINKVSLLQNERSLLDEKLLELLSTLTTTGKLRDELTKDKELLQKIFAFIKQYVLGKLRPLALLPEPEPKQEPNKGLFLSFFSSKRMPPDFDECLRNLFSNSNKSTGTDKPSQDKPFTKYLELLVLEIKKDTDHSWLTLFDKFTNAVSKACNEFKNWKPLVAKLSEIREKLEPIYPLVFAPSAPPAVSSEAVKGLEDIAESKPLDEPPLYDTVMTENQPASSSLPPPPPYTPTENSPAPNSNSSYLPSSRLGGI